MADLITAARKQLEYARNEFKSGDTDAGNKHLDKVDEFLNRIANEPEHDPAAEHSTPPTPPSTDLDLSSNQSEAIGQVYVLMGLDQATTHSDGELLDAAEKAGIDNAILALLGFFTPANGERNPAVDYRLVDKFKTTAEDGGIVDKPEYANEGAWAAYINGE